MMKKQTPAPNPDAYVALATGWQRAHIERLREAVLRVPGFEETIKWGHLVYILEGPALLIRADTGRVILGFWRGQRLRDIEPRLKPGGKYEMASFELWEDTIFDDAVVEALARKAAQLNLELGNPQDAAKKK